jgi:Peptidase M30
VSRKSAIKIPLDLLFAGELIINNNFQKHMKSLSIKFLFAPIVLLALVSCGGGGGGGPSPEPALVGALTPECSGTGCPAVTTTTATTYGGSGIGVWRFNNTSGADVSFNVNIAGVTAGKTATLIFSNGSQSTASAPSSGVLASPVAPDVKPAAPSAEAGNAAAAAIEQSGHDDAHTQMLEKNRAVANGLMRSRSTNLTNSDLASNLPGVARLSFSPAVGADKTWIDNFPTTPVSYATKAQFFCVLPNGRNVVWWVDPNIVTSKKFTQPVLDAALKSMQASYCGTSVSGGGLAQLNTLLGDVWGPAAAKFVDVIYDTPSLQDVNVVLLNVPTNSGWAGYFYGGNNQLKSSRPNSNEALAFFINADQLKDSNFITSTLLHESTHMVNFYQRGIVQTAFHDTWLEETSAMMTEDIVAPAVINGYNKIMSVRLPAYMSAGGNVSYLNWPDLQDSSSHYALGGGFGAFLNRRYGLAIYQQLITSCASTQTSYDCLDGLIKAKSGLGFSDEFSRFGATVFGQLPAVGAPAGYGYPGVQAGAYALQANDLSAAAPLKPAKGASNLTATSQTYQRDTIASGKTSYVRNNVVVPARTTLTVTIK